MEALMEEVHLMQERDPAAKALVFSQVPLDRYSHVVLVCPPHVQKHTQQPPTQAQTQN